jgi:uroporphyrin-III C-methyltransferase/precorrin-2 dehydrogenase/sirohydrochlorin ferrochelatase
VRGYSEYRFLTDIDVDHFPAFLKLDGKSCLLVGGGEVAARKARLLLAAGARLTIVAPQISPAIDEMLVTANWLTVVRRSFRPSDLERQWLVVSATGDPQVEKRVAGLAEKLQLFCNCVDDLANCSYITPSIVDRSPILVAISSGGTAPVLARRIRAQLETLLPKNFGELAVFAGRWRKRVAARFGNFRARVRFWEALFDSTVASDVLAGNNNAAAAGMQDRLQRADNGVVGQAWLVGAGPGDPELLTIRALQTMQSADIILHDRLVSPGVLALARRDARLISVGKTPGCSANGQDEINAQLVDLVAAGNRVCRLKGGDPFIFGRGGEEAEALDAAGLAYEVVPGITSAAGCAAAAGIPLTHRDAAQSLVLVTAHGKNSVDNLDWASLARERQTLAVYMGVRRFAQLMRELVAHGRGADTPIAIIERGTTPQQRVLRGSLGQLTMLAEAHRVAAPAMLIIGEVARLGAKAERICYTEDWSSKNTTTAITGTAQ